MLRAVRTRLAPKVDPKLGNSDEGGESVSDSGGSTDDSSDADYDAGHCSKFSKDASGSHYVPIKVPFLKFYHTIPALQQSK